MKNYYSPAASFPSACNAENIGFRAAYLRVATHQELNNHRDELYDRCQYVRSAAKYVAMYIFDETVGVFDYHLPTKLLYAWLKTQFGLKASTENFYKACQQFSNYTNRK